MSNDVWDLIVIGAGPAGATAAAIGAGLGLRTLVVDEARAAGGQVYRQPVRASGKERDDHAIAGDALRAQLAASTATFAQGHVIWDVTTSVATADFPSQFSVSTLSEEGPATHRSRALIVAAGVTERFYARPGWTLPGVIGLGAATVMIKSAQVLPGRRVVVAGAGPLLSLVAHLLIDAGATVAAVVDKSPLSAWIGKLPAMASRPDLLLRGIGWQRELLAKRVPVYRDCDLQQIHGIDGVEGVTLQKRDGTTLLVDADAVCIGHGLVPSTEIYRMLGVEQRYEQDQGGWVPAVDANQRTGIRNLYGAGDGARLLGAAAAPLQGELAALSAAEDLKVYGARELSRRAADVKGKLERASRFGRAMAQISAPRPELMRAVPDDTVVCRCEDVNAGQIRTAVAGGARTLNALKSATRCGMGPCGGRSCAASASGLMECSGIPAQQIGQSTARPPLRPISLGAITGTFDYQDIPLPEPAPV